MSSPTHTATLSTSRGPTLYCTEHSQCVSMGHIHTFSSLTRSTPKRESTTLCVVWPKSSRAYPRVRRSGRSRSRWPTTRHATMTKCSAVARRPPCRDLCATHARALPNPNLHSLLGGARPREGRAEGRASNPPLTHKMPEHEPATRAPKVFADSRTIEVIATFIYLFIYRAATGSPAHLPLSDQARPSPTTLPLS